MEKIVTRMLGFVALFACLWLGMICGCCDKCNAQDTGSENETEDTESQSETVDTGSESDTTDTEYDSGPTPPNCDDPNNFPQGQPDSLNLDFETLEVKIIPLKITDPLGGELTYEFNSDWTPFQAEIIDYQASDADAGLIGTQAIKITAPEFALMPGSDYLTSVTDGIYVSNICNGVVLEFQLNMLYGCVPISPQIDEWDGGMRHVKIIGTRYRQDTGVTVAAGHKVDIFASGEICWSEFDQNTCQGAAQQLGNTWGVWAKINDDYFPLQEVITIENSGADGELSFIVPDGSRPQEYITAGDEQYCTDDYYKDSGGKGIDVSFYVE